MAVVSTGSPIISAQSTISLLVVKDDGSGFIGVADKGKKAVRLSTADWCVTDLINNDKLCLSDIFQAESLQPAQFLRRSRIRIRFVIFSKHTV